MSEKRKLPFTISTSRKGDYKVARVDVDRDQYPDQIVPVALFTDLQCGHKNFREDLFHKHLLWARENRALCLGGGDWVENATKNSVGKGWAEQVLTPKQQRRYLHDAFKPIADQFIGVVPGNHEFRSERETDIDPLETLAELLEINYFPTELFSIISAQTPYSNSKGNGTSYSLYLVHSASSHKSSGLAINKVQRDWAFVQADIKVKGHDHHLDFDWEECIGINKSTGKAKQFKQYIVLGGSLISREDSYAAKSPMQPTTVGQVGILLDMHRDHRNVRPYFTMDE